MEANGLSMCKTCVGLEMKLSDQLDLSHLKIIQCNGCLGYLKDNSKYVRCGLESAELMAICLKSIVKLNRFKLIDAKFVWTEPHSKRIKVKVTIEEETFQSVKVRQSFIAEYKVSYFKCEDCNRQYHNNTWRAVVQLRQKVLHQRTFYHLEQIILQHNAHRMASNIDLVTNGMDVFFMERNHAEKFVHFVSTVAPVKIKASTKLVSTDNHNNTANIKYSHAVEIAPICKFDLVIVPKKIAQHMGQTTSNLLIVSKVTSNLHFVDPFSGQCSSLSADKYWKHPFLSTLTSANLSNLTLLDIEIENEHYGFAEIVRESDFGVNDTKFQVKTHLASQLQPGQDLLGYDLTNINTNIEIPNVVDFIIVKRHYQRQKNLKKLKSVARKSTKPSDISKQDEDYQTFLNEFHEQQI